MDLDNDGTLDLISGSWPGEIFFFKGKPSTTQPAALFPPSPGTPGEDQGEGLHPPLSGQIADPPARVASDYDPPIKLKDKKGHTINITGGVTRNDDRELLIAGDAKFETKDGKQVITYEGQTYPVDHNRGYGITGTASAVFAVDLDNDGDKDLVIGNIRGDVYFLENEGDAKHFAFGKEKHLLAANKPIKVEGDAGPTIADWDGDGQPDLLVGSGDGSVTLYRNSGRSNPNTHLPLFESGREIVPKLENFFGSEPSAEPTRGIRTKVCVADFNGDGRPDLLVGDFAQQKPNLPDPTPEQKAEQDKIRAEIKALQPKYSELMQIIFNQTAKKPTPEVREKAQKEFSELQKKMMKLQQQLPPESEEHGWVWVYLRKSRK